MVADRFGLVTVIVGVPVAVWRVSVTPPKPPSIVHPNALVGLPNTRLPIVRGPSRLTVNGAVKPAVANVAVAPIPSATAAAVQLPVSLQFVDGGVGLN